MKRILWLLLLPSLSTAQQHSVSQGDVDGLRKSLAPVLQQGIVMMEQARGCLENVLEQTGFDRCFNEMPDKLERELISQVKSPLSAEGALSVVYSANTKQRLMQYLDGGIESMNAMKRCFDQSDTVDRIRRCVDGVSPDGRTDRKTTVVESEEQLSGDW